MFWDLDSKVILFLLHVLRFGFESQDFNSKVILSLLHVLEFESSETSDGITCYVQVCKFSFTILKSRGFYS